jgi:hypothetical protein
MFTVYKMLLKKRYKTSGRPVITTRPQAAVGNRPSLGGSTDYSINSGGQPIRGGTTASGESYKN